MRNTQDGRKERETGTSDKIQLKKKKHSNTQIINNHRLEIITQKRNHRMNAMGYEWNAILG